MTKTTINFDQVISKNDFANYDKITYENGTGYGRLFYFFNCAESYTREEILRKMGDKLLPFFQANNVHHGIRILKNNELEATNGDFRKHAENVLKMNEILDKCLTGKLEKVKWVKKYMGGDQLA